MTNDKQRERLVELLHKVELDYLEFSIMHPCEKSLTAFTVDSLLANGVIVPPCKVGDKVWTKYGDKFEIERIEILKDAKIFRCGNPNTDDYMAFFDDEIGTYVFLTKEEAEETLGGVQDA